VTDEFSLNMIDLAMQFISFGVGDNGWFDCFRCSWSRRRHGERSSGNLFQTTLVFIGSRPNLRPLLGYKEDSRYK